MSLSILHRRRQVSDMCVEKIIDLTKQLISNQIFFNALFSRNNIMVKVSTSNSTKVVLIIVLCLLLLAVEGGA